MKLIFGFGNVGEHFANTRHNIGFAVLDALAAGEGIEWQLKDRFKAYIAEGGLAGQKIMLAKPTTYYNLVGESVRAIKDFYKIDNRDILVIHDELALPFGTLRTRTDGSDAGNNGIRSLVAHVGEDIARIRIGTANQHTANHDASDFVLDHFSHEETQAMPQLVQAATQLVHDFVQHEKFGHTSVRIGE